MTPSCMVGEVAERASELRAEVTVTGDAPRIIDAVQRLSVSQGPLAGSLLRLGAFQRQFVEGAFASGVNVGVLSVGRGNGKTALAAGLAVTHLLGEWDAQPQREVVIAARTRDQATTCFRFCTSFLGDRDDVVIRRGAALEIEFNDGSGPHVLKAVASTGKGVLGGAATLAILDERAAWMESRAAEMEAALLTSLGKRTGRALIISTSAPDDANDFSRWLDTPPSGCYVQEHRAPEGLPADDWPSLLAANPGSAEGIGATKEWLVQAARQAMDRGGTALAGFRNLHRNERVHVEARGLLIELDAWAKCEVDTLPPREGPCVIGLDLGGSASMSAAAFYWPNTGRLETRGWFPTQPSLALRGVNDGVGRRYVEMADRRELRTIGERTVPVAAWVAEVLAHVGGEPVAAILADRFKAGEVGEALTANNCKVPVIWRGFGWKDGAEDIERFRRAVYDRRVASERSLLLHSALADAICLIDPAGNPKLAKGKATGRIDAAAAAVIAVAEGHRIASRPARKVRAPLWA